MNIALTDRPVQQLVPPERGRLEVLDAAGASRSAARRAATRSDHGRPMRTCSARTSSPSSDGTGEAVFSLIVGGKEEPLCEPTTGR